jgi:hypothetical protein
MAIPEKYHWLLKETSPNIIKKALSLYDVTETLGKKTTLLF